MEISTKRYKNIFEPYSKFQIQFGLNFRFNLAQFQIQLGSIADSTWLNFRFNLASIEDSTLPQFQIQSEIL